MEWVWKARRAGEAVEYAARTVPELSGWALGYAWEWVRRGGSVDASVIRRLTERHVLRGALTVQEKQYFDGLMSGRKLSPYAFPLSFYRVPSRFEVKVFGKKTLVRLHKARLRLVQERLPAARHVLDLGGAVDKHPEGALLAMGYPHGPQRVTIVDLPDSLRRHRPGASPLASGRFGPTEVSYVFCGMTGLGELPAASYDLIWSGQSIEHITEQEGENVLREAWRLLRPGGRLCLDTPNGPMMRLISRSFAHPEHRIEYEPERLAEKARQVGFVVEALEAVTPLPISRRLGRISKLEIHEEARVGGSADTGLSFFLQALKPAGGGG